MAQPYTDLLLASQLTGERGKDSQGQVWILLQQSLEIVCAYRPYLPHKSNHPEEGQA